MQFLRTLIWVLLAGIVVAFSFNNWVTVPVRLWAGLVADINLPLLLGIAFAIGFLPLYLIHRAGRWRLKSRLANAERAIETMRLQAAESAIAAPVTLAPDPIVDPITPPPAATPDTAQSAPMLDLRKP